MFELKEDHIYIAKANIVELDKKHKKAGAFFNVSVSNLIRSLEKLADNADSIDEGSLIEFKILPLNHKSDKFTHSVKINIVRDEN